MQISSMGSQAGQMPQIDRSTLSKIKQNFDKVGTALESGNLSDAKEALAELEKNAPKGAGDSNNPMSSKMDALSKAVESGDLKGAQDAYADIKKTMSQRGGRPGGAGGAMPGGAPPSGAGGSSAANKTYDAKDTNHDGKVSWDEELASKQAQAESTSKSAASVTNSSRSFDAFA